MITFHQLKVKNLASVGNTPIIIDLDRNPTTLVCGKNGAGKSSILLDALTFALYDKPYRAISKNALVNRINGSDMEVTLTFTSGDKHVSVFRSAKPSRFEITVEGKLIEQTTNRDQQAWFVEHILQLDYATYLQTVCVGKTSYTPFMRLTAAKRREFVESILSLNCFSAMQALNKEDMKVQQRKLTELDLNLTRLSTLVKVKAETLAKRQREIANQIASAESKQSEEQAKLAKLDDEKQSLWTTLPDPQRLAQVKQRLKKLSQDASVLTGKKSQAEYQVSQAKRDINFFKANDYCPTCYQSITTAIKQASLAKSEEQYREASRAQQEAADALAKNQAESEELERLLTQVRNTFSTIQQLESRITQMKLHLAGEATDFPQVQSLQHDEDELARLEAELDEVKSAYNGISECLAYHADIETLLKDDGIKATLIRQSMPAVNHLANDYLTRLGMFATLKMSETFDLTVKLRGFDECEYDNLSEGEKLRVDMAILFTWRDIAQSQSTSTSLLILDEIFDSSVDAQGADAFATILKASSVEHTFVITHTPEKLVDQFTSTITFEKRDGFTYLV